MFSRFSQIGRAMMLPIAILPVAGLLLGLGGALSNPSAVEAYPFLDQGWLQGALKIMSAAGGAVFTNLALIFAIGVAVGLAKGDKGTAGLAAGVAYVVFTATINGLLELLTVDALAIDTGVVGSIVIGSTVAYLHNHYRQIQLPTFLGFFGGSRFIPIVSSLAAIILGFIFYLIWPPFQSLLTIAGEKIALMGSFGTFLYGFLLRLTGAVGLHHTIYPLFWYTSLGGVEMVEGAQIVGAQNIFFAQLADPNHQGLFTYGTRFFAGRFATMMFGLPAACLAMYHGIPKAQKSKNVGLYFSGALTSFLTGITEPIEYMFLFAAPWLYVLHAFLDGLSFWIADLLQVRIGNSFSGGLIDFLLFGVLQGNHTTHWLRVIPIGLVWAGVYYIVFRLALSRFDVAVPGNQPVVATEEESKERVVHSLEEEAQEVVSALGGYENLKEVTACATRLRVTVTQKDLVDIERLKALGAVAVVEVQDGIQAIYGAKADLYSQIINDMMQSK